MSSVTGRRGTFPGPPGPPRSSGVDTESIELVWLAPSHSGGSGIQGYRIDVRTGGDGDFTTLVAHTRNLPRCKVADASEASKRAAEPQATIEGLLPMTWYEFRVAAINAVAAGPPSSSSEPILTRAPPDDSFIGGGHSDDVLHVGGRRRRTKQHGIEGLLAVERDAFAAASRREAELKTDIERSKASMVAWEKVFRVRHRRSPRDEDREESRILREEAHTLRVLRHAAAEAALETLAMERALLVKEKSLTKAQVRKWEQTHAALVGHDATDEERRDDPKYGVLDDRLKVGASKLQRLDRRVRRYHARLEAALAELGQAAGDETAGAALLEALEAAQRKRAVADGGAGGDGLGGDATGGGLGGDEGASGGRGGRVVRRWTQGLRGDVARKGADYLSVVLDKAKSREVLDAIAPLTDAQLRKAILLFSNADLDGDGILSRDEYRAYLERRHGADKAGTAVVYDAMFRKADLNGDGLIDMNEWYCLEEQHGQSRGGGGDGGEPSAEAHAGDVGAGEASAVAGAGGRSSADDGTRRAAALSVASSPLLMAWDVGSGLEDDEDDDDDDDDEFEDFDDAAGDGSPTATNRSRGSEALPTPLWPQARRAASGTRAADAPRSGGDPTAAAPQPAAATSTAIVAARRGAERSRHRSSRGGAEPSSLSDDTTPHIPLEYLALLIDSSKSRAVDDVVGERAVALARPEVREAAAAFLALDADRNGLLSLDEFEQLILGRAMEDTAAAGLFSHAKMRKMFDHADVNKDGLVDFNEFVRMRMRAERRQASASPSKHRTSHAEGHRHVGGAREHVDTSTGTAHEEPHARGKAQRAKRAKRASREADRAAEVGSWVEEVRVLQKKGEDDYNRAVAQHAQMVERRFGAGDALADLDADELLILETELLTEFPPSLSAAACASCLSLLALRLGKLFAPNDVDALIGRVLGDGSNSRGSATCSPEQLVAGLRAMQRSR